MFYHKLMIKNGAFSNLRIIEVNDKKIYIVDTHQYVLPIWYYYSKIKRGKYTLVSFDQHTDIRTPFSLYSTQKGGINEDKSKKIRLTQVKKLKRANLPVLIKAISNLGNDEHIILGKKLDIIKDYYIIHRSNCCIRGEGNLFYNEHCREICQTLDNGVCRGNCSKELLDYNTNGLEDRYLSDANFKIIEEDRIILDFDLDYFHTRESLNPIQHDILTSLILKADTITIARSETYFEDLVIDSGFTIHQAEEDLINLIRKCH